MLETSDVVVEGVISQLLPARWSTEDGEPLDDPKSDDVRGFGAHIRTPVELSVKRGFKGKPVGDTIKFSFVGGRVGDVAHTFAWNEVFEKDARVIVFWQRVVTVARPTTWRPRRTFQGCTWWSTVTRRKDRPKPSRWPNC